MGEPLNLGHRERLEPLLRRLGDGLSDYSFANLYLFRQAHQYHFVSGSYPFLTGRTYDGLPHVLPLFDLGEADHCVPLRLFAGSHWLFPISAAALERLGPVAGLAAYCVEDDSDYVYAVRHLQTYSGPRRRKKRNLVRQYLALGGRRVEALGPASRGDALEVLDCWQAESQRPADVTDYWPCREALTHSAQLGLNGYVHYAQGAPVGFVMTRAVHPRTCVVCFAKGTRSVPGVYPHMFQHLAVHVDERFEWINFEQDLGRPNFRKNKRSYAPDRLLPKYRVLLPAESTVAGS